MSVKFDRTYIVVRQRNILETFDLSLQIVRDHALKLFLALAIGCLPWLVLDAFIMYRWYSADQYAWGVYLVAVLVVAQAPLGTAVITDYMGSVMFKRKPSVRRSSRHFINSLGKLFVLHGIVRLAIPISVLVALVSPDWSYESIVPFAILLLPSILGVSLLIRGLRPFATEVVMLEKPAWSHASQSNSVTFASRNQSLHRNTAADLMGSAIVSYIFGFLLAMSFYFIMETRYFLTGSSSDDLLSGAIAIPIAFWLAAGYETVARFLAYINLRIRQEGWEVELKLRAEATKYMEKALK